MSSEQKCPIGETALQKAMWNFEYDLRRELQAGYGIDNVRMIAFLVSAWINVRNARAMVEKTSRSRHVEYEILSIQKDTLRRCEEMMHTVAAKCLPSSVEATREAYDRYIKIAEEIFTKMVKFIRERVGELFVEEDREFAYDQMLDNCGSFVSVMCGLIYFGPSVPSKITKLFM